MSYPVIRSGPARRGRDLAGFGRPRSSAPGPAGRGAATPRRSAGASVALLAGLLVASLVAPAALAGQEPASVAGRVLSAETGEAIPGAMVLVRGTDRGAAAGEDGAFRISALEAGTYELEARALGFRTLVRRVTVEGGARVRVALELETQPVELRPVTVLGSREESEEIRERLLEIPGGVEFVPSEAIERSRQANFRDVLRFTPGVWVQPRFGAADESQLSIRGSGLRNNFHLRGVNLLVNGMPYRNADGFTDFESLELLTVDNIQVYKGSNALRFGGSTLGGAIDLRTKTGHTAAPLAAYTQGGSFGFLKAQAASGAVLGDFDYYASYAHTELDGYRRFTEQRRERLNAHAGWRLSPAVDLRSFYFFADVDEELPGSLTRQEMEADPRQANAENVENRWGRDYHLHHLGLQLRARPRSGHTLEVSPYLQARDIVHPIFRVLDQESLDLGLEARYELEHAPGGHDSRLTLGFQWADGETDNLQFENASGERGELAKDQREEAGTVAFYGEELLGLTDRFSAVLGLRFDRTRRSLDDAFLEDGDQTDSRTYERWLPKLGLLLDLPSVDGQLFANASRMSEPPLLLELSSFTVPGFIDLEPQDAWQFEVGTRGRSGSVGWAVSLFDIELRDEIINVNVQPFPDAPFTVPTYRNAERTRHAGAEASLDLEVPGALLVRGEDADELRLRLAYTLGRYEFVEDAAFDGNEIPGIPSHVLQAEVAYRHPLGLSLRPSLEWVPVDYFVDSENTARNDGWAVLGLRGELELQGLGASLFLEGRNLTDEAYSPSVNVDDASDRFFQPADGRSVYAGVRWRLSGTD